MTFSTNDCSLVFLTHPDSLDADLEQPETVNNRLLEEDNITIDAIVIDESGWDHGQTQPRRFRDCFWAFLFILQFGVIVSLAVLAVRNMIKEG